MTNFTHSCAWVQNPQNSYISFRMNRLFSGLRDRDGGWDPCGGGGGRPEHRVQQRGWGPCAVWRRLRGCSGRGAGDFPRSDPGKPCFSPKARNANRWFLNGFRSGVVRRWCLKQRATAGERAAASEGALRGAVQVFPATSPKWNLLLATCQFRGKRELPGTPQPCRAHCETALSLSLDPLTGTPAKER
jgi:hypothetical protein